MNINLSKCNMCPHKCGVNRLEGKVGFCKAGKNVKVALASIHKFEEPCISKINGSGTVFFSNCNLNCAYCQNYEISQLGKGKEVTIEELANIFINLQNNKVNNINLVTPTIYALQIKEAIIKAKEKGLHIPIIYNSSGYENVDTLKELKGYIDIYLPDFKYSNDEIGKKYSNISGYFTNTSKAILEMYKQVGNPIFDNNGIIKRGVIIRNLILPNNVNNTKKILLWIKDNIGKEAYVSIMAQYFPTNRANEFNEINRKISRRELNSVENYFYSLELQNGYIQDLGKHEEEYVPHFDLDLGI